MKEKIEKETKRKKIGLFGGTFNPIHLGHLRGVEEIREAFRLDEIIFIPSAIPPHKAMEEIIDAKHRLEMARLAIASNPYFSISIYRQSTIAHNINCFGDINAFYQISYRS
jgi:nicotinate-nucleotide adenylyltransferase